jgi:biopolymer transport protein ExbD
MAEVNTEGGGGGGGRHKKKRAKKLPTRIDMTPMVDLGFLLLTFFMLATTFSKPKVIELTPPAKTTDTNIMTHVQDSLALTIILSGNNKVYYYEGKLITNPDSNNINLTTFGDNGIRKEILRRNYRIINKLKPLKERLANREISDTTYDKLKDTVQRDKFSIFVIIKTDSLAKYTNVIGTLDEMNICDVGKYALVPVSQTEVLMVRDYNNKHQIK